MSYLELEQPGGILEDDCLDVAADLDGVDGDAGDEVEEDVVAVRPVCQRVRESHLTLTIVTPLASLLHIVVLDLVTGRHYLRVKLEPQARQEPPAEVFRPRSSCTRTRRPQ